MFSKIKSFFKDQSGQAMTEYGLIIALVAVVVIAAIAFLSTGITDVFTNIKDTLTGAGPA